MCQAVAKCSAQLAVCCRQIAVIALFYGVPVTAALMMWKH